MATLEEMGIDINRRNPIPRALTDSERNRLEEFIDSIHYSTRYALHPGSRGIQNLVTNQC
jgi:cyclin-dependent kinase regulatory subunit CKS1